MYIKKFPNNLSQNIVLKQINHFNMKDNTFCCCKTDVCFAQREIISVANKLFQQNPHKNNIYVNILFNSISNLHVEPIYQ